MNNPINIKLRSFLYAFAIHFFIILLLIINNYNKPLRSSLLQKNNFHRNDNIDKNSIMHAVNIDKNELDLAIQKIKNNEIIAHNKKVEIEKRYLSKLDKLKHLALTEKANIKKLSIQRKNKLGEIKNLQHEQQKIIKNTSMMKQQSQQLITKINAKKKSLARENLLDDLHREEKNSLAKFIKNEEGIINQNNNKINSVFDKYVARYHTKVSKNWVAQQQFFGKDLVVKLEIVLSEHGDVKDVYVIKSSGDTALDLSAKKAIWNSSPFPMPTSKNILKIFQKFRFTFRPDEMNRG